MMGRTAEMYSWRAADFHARNPQSKSLLVRLRRETHISTFSDSDYGKDESLTQTSEVLDY